MKPKKQIENIFSTTPTKIKQPNPATPIIIDTREKHFQISSQACLTRDCKNNLLI